MNKVIFLKEKMELAAYPEETLLDVMRRAGLSPDAPCGGQGKCGKCIAVLEDGQQVLACQTKVTGDLKVRSAAQKETHARILTEGAESAARHPEALSPVICTLQVTVPPCPPGESTSDWTRFCEALRRVYLEENGGTSRVDAGDDSGNGRGNDARQQARKSMPRVLTPAPALLSQISLLSKQNGGVCHAVISAEYETQGRGCLSDETGETISVLAVSQSEMPCYLAAFDIGTTTVAAYLMRASDGALAQTASCINPQTQYGGDVINRANYALEQGMEDVTACIRTAVNELLAQMVAKAGIRVEDIYGISIAGNTCMHHLFLGIRVDSLVHAPYNPAVSEEMVLWASQADIHANPNARLFLLPNIAGFVGADTVACLVSTKLAEEKDWTLLIDIGTNGEMVLGRDHDLIACSTAAGPAFEGAGISCGMRGAPGAVSKVTWSDGIRCETIGEEKARGICGSGLLDLASVLLRQGLMDESGELLKGQEIVIADSSQTEDQKPLTITQKDIRQLQLAKAAIASGVHLLAKKKNIALTEIRQVWLAGAFGSFLSPESACDIGLIPPALRGRIRAIGNAAGEGAKQVLLQKNDWAYASNVARKTQFLELATMAEFQDRFVDELEFPELF